MTTTDKTIEAKSPATAPAKPLPCLIVYNNGNAHRVLQLRGSVNSTSKTLVTGPTIPLVVGSNIVERRLWDQWKEQNQDVKIDGVPTEGQFSILTTHKIPATVQRLENEGKVWIEEGPPVASQQNPLASLDDAASRRLIHETLEEPVLKRWLALEKRAAIVELIGKKLEDFKRGMDEAARRAAG